MEKNAVNHSSHSTWRCQYHIVFASKYRRKVIYGQLKADIGYILRKLCEEKKVEIIEAEACADHIHTLVSIPPHLSVAQFMGYLKGKSTLMIFDRHANLKYKYGSRHFWCRGYYVDTVGKNKKAISPCVKNFPAFAMVIIENTTSSHPLFTPIPGRMTSRSFWRYALIRKKKCPSRLPRVLV